MTSLVFRNRLTKSMTYTPPTSEVGLRILYMAGPGDVIGTFQHWRCGEDDPTQVAMTYSGQFFEMCRRQGAWAKLIAYHPRRDRVTEEMFDIEHWPMQMERWRGPMFHLKWYWFSLMVALTAIRQRCDVLVLMSGTHLLPYWIAKLFGKRIVLTEHCVLWPTNLGRRRLWRVVHALDRAFFQRGADAIISMSQDITAQIDELTGGQHGPLSYFVPTYRRQTFAALKPAIHRRRPFRVLYVGRVEPEKGAFALLEIAGALKTLGRTDVVLDVAGDGSALPKLRAAIAAQGLESFVTLHGYCRRPQLVEAIKESHVLIVPTKSAMIEGFNKVVVEAVLAQRPFITSNLCPAVAYVREAGVEVPADDVTAYLKAILHLADDESAYQTHVTAANQLASQFYDMERSWSATLWRSLTRADANGQRRQGEEISEPLTEATTVVEPVAPLAGFLQSRSWRA